MNFFPIHVLLKIYELFQIQNLLQICALFLKFAKFFKLCNFFFQIREPFLKFVKSFTIIHLAVFLTIEQLLKNNMPSERTRGIIFQTHWKTLANFFIRESRA